MYRRLLNFLRCPECRQEFTLLPAESADAEEFESGLLCCANNHWYPLVGGIPRLLPGSVNEHWEELKGRFDHELNGCLRGFDLKQAAKSVRAYDRGTRDNFSAEWDNYNAGDRTWGIDLNDRVKWYFLDPIRIPPHSLVGKVMLDAGCGNGSQAIAYSSLGVEVIAVDLSSGLEHGETLRRQFPGIRPELVHFIQGDLVRPPLKTGCVDLIHSAGVLHHTPDTRRTFAALRPLLKPGGTFYVWLYKYEPGVTPLVNTIRAVTTRMNTGLFAPLSKLMAPAFIGFCWLVDALGIRSYPRLSYREAALALMDIFGAPYAHYHSFDEVAEWYRDEGFADVWACNDGRRGFGVCGRLPTNATQSKTEVVSLAS